jgi:hypothetical protein
MSERHFKRVKVALPLTIVAVFGVAALGVFVPAFRPFTFMSPLAAAVGGGTVGYHALQR